MIAIDVIVIALYAAFVRQYPWHNPYELKAVFSNASNLQEKSPVRIAGVTVGKVTGIQGKKGSSASVVTMELSDDALPIHSDATLKIRPRIFLEGNFFVDLQPGSAEKPDLPSDAQIPMTQTFAPVQIDQVLGALQASERQSLQTLLQGYGNALNGKPKPGEDAAAQADPDTRGMTAAEALNH